MAFTLHWSNHSFGDAVDTTRKGKERRINDVYDRLQSLDPILSIQRDVLFPRAAANFDYESTDSSTMGCVGHGIDNDFPLKQKGKYCTPLVFMREGKNSNASVAAEDLCATPVLNWEKYCVELKASTGRHRKRKKSVKKEEESGEDNKEDKKETCKTAEKFVNIPKVRVEGTWNYKFTNKGACDWVPGNQRKGRIKLAVGHGDKLRIITLDINKGIKNIAYQVAKVEEEFVDGESERRENDTISLDCIYQISSMKADQVIAVRRDSTIDLYDVESSPRKLETVKPGGYSKVYVGKDDASFLTFDVNPERVNEIATIDSSMILQFHDFVAEKSTRPVLLGPMLDIKNRSQQRCDSIRKFTINKATGISYAVNPALLYIHHDSSVYLYDRRKPLYASWNSQKCYELMDLRSNVEILSISDHSNGSYGSSDMRPEYISCVQRSCNSNYYYVGTSSRIFTMDWRVPRNPVVRASHGMKGAMSYMDVVLDRGNEIVVGGSQRGHEIFSMVLDYKHEECRTRAGCAAVNPILKSYPRHLCEPSSVVEDAQYCWSSPPYRMKARIEAWCSGLSAAVIPLSERLLRATDLSPIFIASTNTFGDVFYQEWFPPGALESFAGGDTSSQTQLDLLQHWADLRPMLGANDLNEDTPDPVDCSIVVEETGNLTKKFVTVRSDPFTPMSSCIPNSSGKLEFLCDDMRSYKGPLIDKFVSVWESGRPHPAAAPDRSFDDGFETESRNLESELVPQSVTGTIPSDIQIKEEVPEPDYSPDSDIEEIPVEPKRLDLAAASVVSDNEDYVESDVFSQSLLQTVYHQFNEGYGMDTLELSCSNYDDYSYSVPAYPGTSQPNIPSTQPVSNVSRNASQSQTTIPSTSSQSQSQSKNIPKRRAGFL